jgi:hypothetical protein
MIVRSAVSCDTCKLIHVVRMGMGQENHQSHRFPCRGCGEEIGVDLKVDYANVSYEVIADSNCTLAQEAINSPIVNLDPNFLVPAEFQGKDRVFPRLHQGRALANAAIAAGAEPKAIRIGDPDLEHRAVRLNLKSSQISSGVIQGKRR